MRTWSGGGGEDGGGHAEGPVLQVEEPKDTEILNFSVMTRRINSLNIVKSY